MKENKSSASFDVIGICASAICIVHCLAIPVLMVFGVNSILWAIDQEWVELAIIVTSLTIGSISFILGYRRHKQHFVPVLFVAGFLLIVNGESVGQEWLGITLSVVGASIIAYAHLQNLNWKRTLA